MKANIIFVKISFVLCTSTPFSGNTCMFEFFFVEILEISLLVDKKFKKETQQTLAFLRMGNWLWCSAVLSSIIFNCNYIKLCTQFKCPLFSSHSSTLLFLKGATTKSLETNTCNMKCWCLAKVLCYVLDYAVISLHANITKLLLLCLASPTVP